MENPALTKLLRYLQAELNSDCLLHEQVGYTYINCVNLPFDILLENNQTAGAEIKQTKRLIYLPLEQLIHSEQKIYLRLKVLAGRARKLYARQTVVARIDKAVALQFLADYHLQVPLPGKYRYGLFADGELVSVAIFSGGRKMSEKGADYRSFELLRFCHKSDYLVIGGLSKMIQRFAADFNPDDIMTYVDKSWSQDSSLAKLGFVVTGETTGQKIWINDNLQTLVQDDAQLRVLKESQPSGYCIVNHGSIKMVLAL